MAKDETPSMTAPETREVLKPCPFCGGRADYRETHHNHWHVACMSCGIQHPVVIAGKIDPKPALDAAWNTRATTAREQRLREALEGLEQFFARPGECSIERFDRLAEQYRRETGEWAPGKSIPIAYNDSTPPEVLRERYDAWVDAKASAARAALAHRSQARAALSDAGGDGA